MPPLPLLKTHRSPAVRITLIYLLIGTLWVVVSDLAVPSSPTGVMSAVQLGKAIAFAAISGLAVFLLVQRHWRRNQASIALLAASRQQLAESLARWESLAGNLPDFMVLVTNLDHRVLYSNRPTDLVGVEIRPGIPLLDQLPAGNRARMAAILARALGGEVVRIDTEEILVNGEARFHELTAVPVSPRAGAVGVCLIDRDVTERARLERDAKRTAGRLRAAIQVARLAVWEVWPLTGKADEDGSVSALQGFAPGELPSTLEAWLDRVHESDRPRLDVLLRQSLAGEISSVENVEYRIRRKDGSIGWLQIHAQLFRDGAHADNPRILGVSMDVTARRSAEEELLQRNELIETLFDAAPIGLGITVSGVLSGQASREFDRVNPTLAALFGSLTGQPAVVHVSDLLELVDDSAREKLTGFLEDPSLESGTCSAALSNGQSDQTQFVDLKVLRLANQERMIWLAYDNTDRVLAERELDESCERLVLVVLGLNDGLFDWPDVTRPEMWWSPRTRALLGVPESADPPLMSDVESRVHPDDLENFQRAVKQTMEHGTPHDQELRMLSASAGYRWFHVRARAQQDANGRVVRMSGSIQDITDRKNIEAELRVERASLAARIEERTGQLELALRVKDQFLANMSHELRTPLNGVLVLAESLAERVYGPLTPKQDTCINGIVESGRHLLELINDVLDLAKIDAEVLSVEPGPVNVHRLCRGAISIVKDLAQYKNLELGSDVGSDIPELLVDERRVKQVLVNLLSNAIKFTPGGGAVRLRAARIDDGLELSVTDTGIGIADADRDRLFQPFTQLDASLNRRSEGTGLGLVLVRRLVEMHGGTVQVESAPGAGSCFTVCIPQEWGDEARSTSQTNSAGKTSSDGVPVPTGRGQHILVVDDNATNLEAVATYLDAIGYTTDRAADGPSALACIRQGGYNAVLLDIQMPGMDGLEVLARLREPPGASLPPIIVISALAMKGDEDRCLDAGADAYLPKPLSLADLRATLSRLLDAGAETSDPSTAFE